MACVFDGLELLCSFCEHVACVQRRDRVVNEFRNGSNELRVGCFTDLGDGCDRSEYEVFLRLPGFRRSDDGFDCDDCGNDLRCEFEKLNECVHMDMYVDPTDQRAY